MVGTKIKRAYKAGKELMGEMADEVMDDFEAWAKELYGYDDPKKIPRKLAMQYMKDIYFKKKVGKWQKEQKSSS